MKADSPRQNVSGLARDLLLLAVVSAVALFATRDDLRRLPCTTGDRATRTMNYTFGTPVAGAPMTLVTEGCTETAQGIFVPPHGRCQVNFWLSRDPGERARIQLGVLRPEGVTNVLMFQGDENREPEIAARDMYLTDEIDLPLRPGGTLSRPELILKVTNQGDSPARIIHRARYSTFADATNCLVDFRRLFAAWGAVVFCAIGLWQLRGSIRGRWLIVLVALGMVVCSFFVASAVGLWTAVAALLFLLHQAAASWKSQETRRSILTTAALWAIGMFFVYLRYPYLAEAVNARLDPDAVGYRSYADGMLLFSPNGFFSGQFSEREPLYIFASHIAFRLFGSSDLHLRYVSFLCALPIPFLTYWITRCAGARRIASCISAFVVTLATPYLHRLPSRGLRDDLFMTASAAFVLITFLSLRSRSNWRWLAVAAAGVACMWTRSMMLVFALAFFTWLWLEGILHRNNLDVFGWARRWRIWEAAACLTMIFLSFVPIRFAWKRINGHSDYPERVYVRWIANIEFQNRLGTPGFPTKEDFQIRTDAGPPLTMREYLLRLHTPRELAWGTFRGWVKAIRHILPDFKAGIWINGAVAAVFIALLIFSLFLSRARVVTIAGLSSLSYAGFFYDRGLIELRSAAHALPLFSAAALLTVDLGVRALRRQAGSTNQRSFRAKFHEFRTRAAPTLSTARAIVVASCLALAAAAAVALRFPPMPSSPNASCLTLQGFYWKVATALSWPVAVTLPLFLIVVAIAFATRSGFRWWAAVLVALFGSLIGFLSSPPETLSGSTPRTFLWQQGDTIERVIALDPSMRGRPARLRYYVREPFRTIRSNFSYRIEVNDQPVGTSSSTGQCTDCIAFQWREVALPAGALEGDRITIRLQAVSDGDQDYNYVDIGRVPFWRFGMSRWNGNEHDLSPDPGENGGTLLIGLSFPATASHRAVPLWLGR